MAKQRKIGAIIALDGEREFKTAVTSCNKSLATMKSEMKLVSAQTTGSANTLEALRKKHDVLQRTLDEQAKKEEAVRKGLEHAQEDYNRVGSELEQYKTKLSKAQETLKKMEESQDTTKEAMAEQQKVVSELSTTVEKGEVSYQKAESRVQDWKKSLNNAEAQTITATRALNENSAYMQEAEKSADGCATSIDAFGKQVNVAAEATDNLNTSVNKIFVTEKIGEIADNISGKMRDLASSAYDAAKELDEGYDTIVTKTGATGKALDSLQESANNVFGDMPADMQDVGTAIGEVNTRFGQTGKVLEDTSKQFMKFAEINDTDLNESIDVSDRIMEQFGITTEQTSGFLGLLTQRGQETGKSVTELMSQLDSNAALFKELDLSVEESANLLAIFETNGVDAGVALKGLKTATNNYAKEGLSARQGLEKTIDRIKKAKTSTEALALAQDTFGSKGAQVMADGIREGRISLDDLSDSMDNYKNVVEDTFETTLDPWDKATVAANNLKTAGSELVGEFFEVLAPAIDSATDTVKKISKEFRELPEPVKEVTAVVGAVGAAAGIAGPQILKVYSAVKTLKTASEAGKAIETSVLYVTNVQIKQDIIESTHSQINILQSSIESKVSKNGIISSINQSSEKVSISASKINFNGLVTANNYFQILADGSFVATYGYLGGWTVKDGIIKSNDQKIVLDPVNNKIYFDDGDNDFVTELSPDGTRTNFLTVDGGIVGGDAALLISAASSSRIQFYDSFSDDGEDEIKLQGNLEVRGTKSRVARTENFSDRLLYCYETPTPMFGDLGCGKTNDRGIAIVDIDPAFSETINSGIEYQVFLQKEGDGDIWIAEKDTEFFMVRGTPNLKFSWELKCIQKNFEHLRLDEKEVQEAAQKDARDTQKDYNIIIDTVVEDYDKEMEELINESN